CAWREAGVEPEKSPSVVYEAFDAGSHLFGVVGILASLEWDNFRYDPDPTRRSLTAPGVTAAGSPGSPRSSATASSRRTSACWPWTRGGAAGVLGAGSWRRPSRGWGPGAWTSRHRTRAWTSTGRSGTGSRPGSGSISAERRRA
ncbi:MAG: hypothetical protein AVDCRST_MAG22-2321, partial [uncultured Rubrobacteraceae bacterium]